MTRRISVGRPCCNVTEPDGILCNGTERAGWPVFVCDTCGGNCGALAHEHHRDRTPIQAPRGGDDQVSNCPETSR
jgi:hypothetical protein